jgi:DNA-binding CsgD family transcriptional regulator
MISLRIVYLLVFLGQGFMCQAALETENYELRLLLDEARVMQDFDSDSAVDLYNSIYSQSREAKDTPLIIESLLGLAQTHIGSGQFMLAFPKIKEAKILAKDLKETQLILRSISLEVRLYAKLGNTSKQLKAAFEYLEKAKSMDSPDDVAWMNNTIGDVYRSMRQSDNARKFIEDAQSHFVAIHDTHGILATSNNLALVYDLEDDYSQALRMFFNMLKHQEQMSQEKIAIVYSNIGRTSYRAGLFDQSEEFLQKSIVIREKLDDPHRLAKVYNEMATLKKLEMDFAEALSFGLRALDISKGLDSPFLLRDINMQLSEIEEALGNWESAYYYRSNFEDYNKIVHNQEKNEDIANTRLEYELGQAQHEMDHLAWERTQAADQQQLTLYKIIALALLILLIAVVVVHRLRLQKKRLKMAIYEHKRTAVKQLDKAISDKHSLERQLHLKNQELMTHALWMLDKNRLLVEVKKEMELIGARYNISSDDQNSFKLLVDQGANVDKDWAEFQTHFNRIHHSFLSGLKSLAHELTSKELRICAMIKSNLTTNEISSLLAISPKSVNMSRYRIHKKLNLPHGEKLSDFLLKATFDEARLQKSAS